MSIKIRPPEPECTITMTKSGWIEVLAFLVQFGDQAATEEAGKLIDGLTQKVREFILNKETQSEFSLTLFKPDALDLYLHITEFREAAVDKQTMGHVLGQIKEFLLGGKHE